MALGCAIMKSRLMHCPTSWDYFQSNSSMDCSRPSACITNTTGSNSFRLSASEPSGCRRCRRCRRSLLGCVMETWALIKVRIRCLEKGNKASPASPASPRPGMACSLARTSTNLAPRHIKCFQRTPSQVRGRARTPSQLCDHLMVQW